MLLYWSYGTFLVVPIMFPRRRVARDRDFFRSLFIQYGTVTVHMFAIHYEINVGAVGKRGAYVYYTVL